MEHKVYVVTCNDGDYYHGRYHPYIGTDKNKADEWLTHDEYEETDVWFEGNIIETYSKLEG